MSDPYVLPVVADGRKWINANQRLAWQSRHRLTKDWRDWTATLARLNRVPHFDKARIECVLHFTTDARRDPANWHPTAKACIDGLVDAGVFDDDDFTRVIGPDMRQGAKVKLIDRGLELVIYPLERP